MKYNEDMPVGEVMLVSEKANWNYLSANCMRLLLIYCFFNSYQSKQKHQLKHCFTFKV